METCFYKASAFAISFLRSNTRLHLWGFPALRITRLFKHTHRHTRGWNTTSDSCINW